MCYIWLHIRCLLLTRMRLTQQTLSALIECMETNRGLQRFVADRLWHSLKSSSYREIIEQITSLTSKIETHYEILTLQIDSFTQLSSITDDYANKWCRQQWNYGKHTISIIHLEDLLLTYFQCTMLKISLNVCQAQNFFIICSDQIVHINMKHFLIFYHLWTTPNDVYC